MKGDAKIIEKLNEVLTAELTAINQYFIHSKMAADWGFKRIAHEKRKESIEEMHDADKVIDRILYLDGVPNMQRYNPVRVGENVQEMHELDLALEKDAVARLNAGIAVCRDLGDNGTRMLLEDILKGEEHAIDELESELHLIATVGLQGYLAEQIKE